MRWPGAVLQRLRWLPRPVTCAACLACVALGCGYEFVRYRSADSDAPRLALPTLENASSEPGLELIVSDALRREFLRRGGMQLVADPRRADWVVDGSVLSVRVVSQSLSSISLALEHSVTLELALRLRGPGGVEDLPRETTRESEIYLASADIEAARKNRSEALRRVSGLIAARVHDALDARAAR